MNGLKHITAGIDWEILVHNTRTGYTTGDKGIKKIIEISRFKAPDLEIGEDLDLLEIRVGMARSYDELFEKIIRAYELCKKIAFSHNMVLVPIGYRECDSNPAGGHIHAGSMEKYEDIVNLYNRLMPFVPAIISLASSSPSIDKKFRSLRIKMQAGYCSMPMSGMNARDSLPQWGSDICIKYPDKSTLEFRASDSQPSPALMAELAALYVGLVAKLSQLKYPPYKPNLIEYGSNRMNAARFGMCATFKIDDSEITASEMILQKIIPFAIDGLKKFGVPPGHFKLISAMAKRRISPADWIAELIPQGTDSWRAIGEITRVFAANADIEEWLLHAHQKKSLPFENPDDALLNAVALDTPLRQIYDELPLPRVYIEKMITKKVSEGKIIQKLGCKNEILLDRTDLI